MKFDTRVNVLRKIRAEFYLNVYTYKRLMCLKYNNESLVLGLNKSHIPNFIKFSLELRFVVDYEVTCTDSFNEQYFWV